jgi:hypothetical protein
MATTMMMTTKVVENHNEEDPPGGEICKEGQGEEEGLVSAKEVRRAAVQVANGTAAFLLMEEVTVPTKTTLSSTVASGVLLWLGAGTMSISLGLLLPQQRPRR